MTIKSLLAPALALLWISAPSLQGQNPVLNNAEGRSKIEKAIPLEAQAVPAKSRKLLIFDLNVNYGGHGSIAYANYAFKLMGEKTGAWTTEISRDPQVFRQENLSRFDAVFLNNNVGNLFEDKALRNNLAEFIYRGGGLLGVHGTAVAFTQWPGAVEDWPEFGAMIGGRGANHKDSDERVILKLDDPDHPINRCFGGKGFEYRDEFFRVHEPYSRQNLRVLLSMDTAKFDPNQGQPRGNCFRADNDYAVAWIRNYGRGRTFYCTIAHNPYVFWDASLLKFYQGAIQFALGDLAAPTTPSAKLTPAVRAQEKLGWRPGLASSRKITFHESIDLASRIGLIYMSGRVGQKISPGSDKSLGPDLSAEDLTQLRLKLNAAGIRLLGLDIESFRQETGEQRKLFAFSRKMGVEFLRGAPAPEMLDAIAVLCEEFDIQFALSGIGAAAATPYSSLEDISKYCRSSRVGVAADITGWTRSGKDPVQAVRTINQHLAHASLSDPGVAADPNSEAGKVRSFLKEIKKLGIKPGMLGIGCETADEAPQAIRCLELINGIAVE